MTKSQQTALGSLVAAAAVIAGFYFIFGWFNWFTVILGLGAMGTWYSTVLKLQADATIVDHLPRRD